ncbi:hypothetical protein BLOT_008733 [Blomia tropicalis]|nr:hypothetical protein BLOT_008733 [Blomia tropicalis]
MSNCLKSNNVNINSLINKLTSAKIDQSQQVSSQQRLLNNQFEQIREQFSLYWLRFSSFYDLLLQLPEFYISSENSEEKNNLINELIICESICDAYEYRRKLFIQISNVIGLRYLTNEKQVQIVLEEHGSVEENNFEKSSNDENDDDQFIENQYEVDDSGRKILGKINLNENTKTCVTLPLYTNLLKSDMNIVLVFFDAEDGHPVKGKHQDGTQSNQQIVISESTISGFDGYNKRQKVELIDNDDNNRERDNTITIEFDLQMQWQIDSICFERMAPYIDMVDIVEKLPGAIYHLGNYYWSFVNDFYRWCATESLDIRIRYVLLRHRFHYTIRLFELIKANLGNYMIEHYEEPIIPLICTFIFELTSVHNPTESFYDPRKTNLDCTSISQLANCLTRLAIDCIDQSKPIGWQIESIDHSTMISVKSLLQQLLRSLFNRQTIPFLYAIYTGLLKRRVLYDQHLAPFITKQRLKQIYEWHPSLQSNNH